MSRSKTPLASHATARSWCGLLGIEKRNVLPHDQIIAKLDESARLFRILILKSTLAIPYTSVFLELDCGYWTREAEQNLRLSLGRLEQRRNGQDTDRA